MWENSDQPTDTPSTGRRRGCLPCGFFLNILLVALVYGGFWIYQQGFVRFNDDGSFVQFGRAEEINERETYSPDDSLPVTDAPSRRTRTPQAAKTSTPRPPRPTDRPEFTPTPATPQPPPSLFKKEDADGDGLIEVSYLEQLNAIRYDLNGDGEPNDRRYIQAYELAFPANSEESVCDGGCKGYELTRSLDFNEADSYASGAVNYRLTGGSGWRPFGDRRNYFHATFHGNGHTIANLYIFSKKGPVALFRYTGASSVIRNIGLVGVEVHGSDNTGSLVGVNHGVVLSSYATGSVSGKAVVGGLVALNIGPDKEFLGQSAVQTRGIISSCYAAVNVSGGSAVGGLVGRVQEFGLVVTSYATGDVSAAAIAGGLAGAQKDGIVSASYATGSVWGGGRAGGLIGSNSDSTVVASYATGKVSGLKTVGGIIGTGSNRTVTASYWDTEASGLDIPDTSETLPYIQGKTTAELQSPTGYTGIYQTWDGDLDDADADGNAATGADDFWHFGTSSQYPVLKVDFDGDGAATWEEFGPQHATAASPTSPDVGRASPNGKYDSDGDRLIEISTLEQLDAIRYDLGGIGMPDDDDNIDAYAAAFPTDEKEFICDRRCNGYELTRSLDFQETESYSSGEINDGWTSGSGWLPIGINKDWFSAVFHGNGHTINNLYISRRTERVDPGVAGLFGNVEYSSVIRSLALIDVEVTGVDDVGSLVGRNKGTIIASYATGAVSGNSAVGGLIGSNDGSIRSSYAAANVSAVGIVGGLAGSNSGDIIASYAAGSVSGGPIVGGLIGLNSGSLRIAYAIGKVEGDERLGGLVGWHSSGAYSDTYWDTQTSGQTNAFERGDAENVQGKTTAELQSPTGYTGIYQTWNADLDDADADDNAATGVDDPWHFGTSSQYPVLKVDFDGDGAATWEEFGHQRTTSPGAG